jgi:hypothetical protein
VKKYGLNDGIPLVLGEITNLLSSKYPSELYLAVILQYARACELKQMEDWISKAKKAQINILTLETIEGIASANVAVGESNKLFHIYSTRLKNKNMAMDQVAIIIQAFLNLQDLKRCRKVIADFNVADLESNSKTLTLLIDIYGRETRLKVMEALYEEPKSIDPDSKQLESASSAVMEVYAIANNSKKVTSMMIFKADEGMKLLVRDYASLFQMQKRQQDWSALQDTIHGYQRDYPELTDSNLNTMILTYYGEHQHIQEMTDFYELLLNRNVRILDQYYAVILSSIAHAEYTKLAIRMVQKTPNDLINSPNSRIWISLFKAVMGRSNLPLVFTLLREVQEIGQKIGIDVYTLLIKECAKLWRT